MPCFATMEWSRHPLRNRPMASTHPGSRSARASVTFAGTSVMAGLLGLAVCLALAPSQASAQYKWIGADGRVNYSDIPPPPDHRRLLRAPGGAASAEAPSSGDARLPYALRTAAHRYPVVLHTAADCAPCEQGRDHLARRGVPFVEKSVRTRADIEAFSTLGYTETQFPAVSVGRERMVGFEASRWDQMLDAAGYPKSSMLPANVVARTVEPMLDKPPAHAEAPQPDPRERAAALGDARRSIDAAGLLLPAAHHGELDGFRF